MNLSCERATSARVAGCRAGRAATRATGALAAALAVMLVAGAAPPLQPTPAAAPSSATTQTSSAKTPVRILVSDRVLIQGDRYELDKAVITYKGSTLSADKAVIVGKSDKAVGTFTGHVSVTQKDVQLTCPTMEMRFKEDKLTASGGVVALRDEDRKDSKGKVSRVRTSIKCDSMDLMTETHDFTAEGTVYIQDSDVKAWSDKAVYSDKDKSLVLTGQVRVVKADGSRVAAELVTYHTQTQNLEVKGAADITTFIE